MEPIDEGIFLESEETRITSDRVIVNTGWTTRMASWNTFGTVLGAFVSLASLVLAWIVWQAQIESSKKVDELTDKVSRYEKMMKGE